MSDFLIVMLNANINVIMLSVVMLNVVAPNGQHFGKKLIIVLRLSILRKKKVFEHFAKVGQKI